MLSFEHDQTLFRHVSKLKQWPMKACFSNELLKQLKQNWWESWNNPLLSLCLPYYCFCMVIFGCMYPDWKRGGESSRGNLIHGNFLNVLSDANKIHGAIWQSFLYALVMMINFVKISVPFCCELYLMLLVILWGKYAQLMLELEGPTSE